MLPRADWQGAIPHAGAMCLLDEVLAWDEASIHARTGSHRAPDNPLRSGGMLRALNLCEYGAQAMAVHGGLLARTHGARARPGLLVALRDVELFVARIDDLAGDLDVHARCLAADARAWQYAFRVMHGTRELARGRAMVALAAD